MRTTIELRNDQRARLLQIAAERGEKGFSGLVQEAVDHYLEELDRRDQAVDGAVSALGSLSDEEADAVRERVAALRSRWR